MGVYLRKRKRISGGQIGLGEEEGVPWLGLVGLEEVGPEPVIGDEGSPALANEAQLRGLFGVQEAQDAHEYVRREWVERTQTMTRRRRSR